MVAIAQASACRGGGFAAMRSSHGESIAAIRTDNRQEAQFPCSDAGALAMQGKERATEGHKDTMEVRNGTLNKKKQEKDSKEGAVNATESGTRRRNVKERARVENQERESTAWTMEFTTTTGPHGKTTRRHGATKVTPPTGYRDIQRV